MKRKDYPSLIKESVEELKKEEKGEREGRIRDRIKFLRYLKEGRAKTIEEACDVVGVSRATGVRILRKYKNNGLKEVKTLGYKPRASKIGKEGEKKLKEASKVEDFGTLREVRDWIAKELDAEYTLVGVWHLLKRLGIKTKKKGKKSKSKSKTKKKKKKSKKTKNKTKKKKKEQNQHSQSE